MSHVQNFSADIIIITKKIIVSNMYLVNPVHTPEICVSTRCVCLLYHVLVVKP